MDTTKIPYTTKTSTIKPFLAKAQTLGVPKKVTSPYLKSIGFTSSNDWYIIPVLKFIGFLDSSGAPTDVYRAYRDTSKAKKVLGKAIMSTYADLYATYPDAHNKDKEALANFFRHTTELGETAVSAMVATFKALCENAEFEELEDIEIPSDVSRERAKGKAERAAAAPVGGIPPLTINIQLQLPATEDQSVYDKLFTSLRKNLLTPAEEEK